jgi:hypothetical protein
MGIPDYGYGCANKLTSTTQMPFEFWAVVLLPLREQLQLKVQLRVTFNHCPLRVTTQILSAPVASVIADATGAYWRPYV